MYKSFNIRNFRCFKNLSFEAVCTKNCRDASGLARKLEGAELTRRGSRSKLRGIVSRGILKSIRV